MNHHSFSTSIDVEPAQDGDVRQCQGCGSTRPHTIKRINLRDKPVLCDRCHAARRS